MASKDGTDDKLLTRVGYRDAVDDQSNEDAKEDTTKGNSKEIIPPLGAPSGGIWYVRTIRNGYQKFLS